MIEEGEEDLVPGDVVEVVVRSDGGDMTEIVTGIEVGGTVEAGVGIEIEEGTVQETDHLTGIGGVAPVTGKENVRGADLFAVEADPVGK